MLLETLINFLDFEKIDKQLMKKIPYFLLLFLILSILHPLKFSVSFIQTVLFVSLVSFMFFNVIFNYRINNYFRDYLDYADFDKFITRFSGILEGTSTLISEGYDKQKVALTFALILLSGGSLLVFFLSVFSLLFYYVEVRTGIQILMSGILLFFVFGDLSKLDFTDSGERKKYSFSVELLEKFTITNPIKKIPFGSFAQYIIFFCLRLISPVANINFTPPYSNILFFYRNKDIDNLIKKYVHSDEGIVFEELEEKRSYSLNTIFTNDKVPSLITVKQNSTKQLFPFLFDPDFYNNIKKNKNNNDIKPDPKIKYTVLKVKSVTERGYKETVGYLFINLFNGIKIKRTYDVRFFSGPRNNTEPHIGKEVKKKVVYCIFLMGKRDVMEGVAKLLSTNAIKVQPEAFGVEAGAMKDYSQR